MTHPSRRTLTATLALWPLAAIVAVAGCAEQTQPASYVAYNYNAVPIDSVVINGGGGVLNVMPYGGGGEVCCVIVPSRWRPGLQVTVKWESGGHWERDAAGAIVVRDGREQFIEGTWKQRTVEIPPYIVGDGQQVGQVHIFFLPNDEVRVLVSRWGAGHPNEPFPYPRAPDAPASAAAS